MARDFRSRSCMSRAFRSAGTERSPFIEPMTSPFHAISGVLLCGGASQRMGSDKALLCLEGEALLDRGIAALGSLAGEVLIAPGSRSRYGDRGLPEALDSEPGQGPAAGILAGLAAATEERVLFVAVDLPHLKDCPLRELVQLAVDQDADIAVLDDGRERPPLVLCVHRRVRASFERDYAAGARRIIDLTKGKTIVRLRVDPEMAVNWNRPEDLDLGVALRDSAPRGERA